MLVNNKGAPITSKNDRMIIIVGIGITLPKSNWLDIGTNTSATK